MNPVFETEHLVITVIREEDYINFSRLLSDAAVVSAIPQLPFSVNEIKEKFFKATNSSINIAHNEVTILGVYLHSKIELVGLCAFLTNDEGDKELGYRFLEEYWGKGYASELAKCAIGFCFNQLNIQKLTADVAITNLASAKVLSKFFKPVKEFYNEADSCVDRRYEIYKENWNS